MMIEAMGLEVTYAYDNLVFILHNAFLLRMGDVGEDLFLYFNQESETKECGLIAQQLMDLATPKGFVVHETGTYSMATADSENLSIQFYDYELTG